MRASSRGNGLDRVEPSGPQIGGLRMDELGGMNPFFDPGISIGMADAFLDIGRVGDTMQNDIRRTIVRGNQPDIAAIQDSLQWPLRKAYVLDPEQLDFVQLPGDQTASYEKALRGQLVFRRQNSDNGLQGSYAHD